MFCVVYEFKVKLNMNAQFEAAWAEFTDAIYTASGSLGSRLHRTDNFQIYVAYAQWPSKAIFERARTTKYSDSQLLARERMRDSVDEAKIAYELNVADDRLR